MAEEEPEGYSLKKSADGIGKLVPVLRDAYGNLVDGFQRLQVDPDWQTIQLTHIDDPVKLELARLAVNFCRRKPKKEELKAKIEFLMETGNLTPKEISEITGIHLATIYRYMPKRLKSKVLGRPTKQEIFAAAKISGISRYELKVKELSFAEIIDKLAKYYPVSFIDWVYELRPFNSVQQGLKLLKRALEAVWTHIEREFGEEWIRNVLSDASAR